MVSIVKTKTISTISLSVRIVAVNSVILSPKRFLRHQGKVRNVYTAYDVFLLQELSLDD